GGGGRGGGSGAGGGGGGAFWFPFLRGVCLQPRHYPCRLRRHLEGCVHWHWPIWRAKVTERSMEPALRPGDCLLIRRTRRIRPGQVVVARHPDRPEMLLAKRAPRRATGRR